ncbi:hypothetical protein RFI_27850 [Reticulomyxa filosa]|uniref:Uncharacterized protein n=1 Tax=Reticulomyxa filosa TaxID=46433 RepID=X6M6J0_RETFI|nr:hypothetical protein RFI_27850 [Reticulomyxa filosa]|eukprot:ETO09524.1 hypothetical protein RFI_27850 [Reticulomyxa filosa]
MSSNREKGKNSKEIQPLIEKDDAKTSKKSGSFETLAPQAAMHDPQIESNVTKYLKKDTSFTEKWGECVKVYLTTDWRRGKGCNKNHIDDAHHDNCVLADEWHMSAKVVTMDSGSSEAYSYLVSLIIRSRSKEVKHLPFHYCQGLFPKKFFLSSFFFFFCITIFFFFLHSAHKIIFKKVRAGEPFDCRLLDDAAYDALVNKFVTVDVNDDTTQEEDERGNISKKQVACLCSGIALVIVIFLLKEKSEPFFFSINLAGNTKKRSFTYHNYIERKLMSRKFVVDDDSIRAKVVVLGTASSVDRRFLLICLADLQCKSTDVFVQEKT